MLGEEKIPYNNAVDNATSNPYDILETMDGKTLEYVMVPGLGEEKDFEGLDLTGKIAVVQRGTLNFGTKAENASKAGAVACIIYDNVSGSLLNAALETYFIPTITITKASSEKLAAAAEKKVSFSKEYPPTAARSRMRRARSRIGWKSRLLRNMYCKVIFSSLLRVPYHLR